MISVARDLRSALINAPFGWIGGALGIRWSSGRWPDPLLFSVIYALCYVSAALAMTAAKRAWRRGHPPHTGGPPETAHLHAR